MGTFIIEKDVIIPFKIQNINEFIISHDLTTLTTSKVIIEDTINVINNDHEELLYIIDKINKESLSITINEGDDTIISLRH